jgi:putative spermidine/putrescine transport system substrate-binding protein
VLANAANFAAGAYKISIDWDFNGPGTIDTFKKAGVTLKYVVPSDVALQGTPYVQAVNAKAPHCAAARLWQEFLYSQNKGKLTKDLTAADLKLSGSKLMKVIMGGQNIWALGAAHPITEVAMAKKKTLVAAPMGFGVPTTAKRVEPTSDQQVAQREFIATEWPKL